MKIEELEIDKVKPYSLNAKKHPQTQIEGLAESIRRFGFTQPIVVDSKNEIIIGHGRHSAALLVGLKKVPCLRLENLSEKEVKALRLIDNRIAETGWDAELLLEEFKDFDFDFNSFNIDFDFINSINFSEKNEEINIDELDNKMFIKFEFSELEYNFIKEKLLEYDENQNLAFLKMAGYKNE